MFCDLFLFTSTQDTHKHACAHPQAHMHAHTCSEYVGTQCQQETLLNTSCCSIYSMICTFNFWMTKANALNLFISDAPLQSTWIQKWALCPGQDVAVPCPPSFLNYAQQSWQLRAWGLQEKQRGPQRFCFCTARAYEKECVLRGHLLTPGLCGTRACSPAILPRRWHRSLDTTGFKIVI